MTSRFRLLRGKTKGPRRGMVLFELVIALTIFTMVAFSLVMALQAAFDAAQKRNRIDQVLRGLANQAELLHTARLQPGDRDVPDDGTGIAYHVTVALEQIQDQTKQPLAGMYRATITAKWQADGDEQDRNISELIYQP